MNDFVRYIKRLRKRLKAKKGFTLIELLAVITIMAILLIIAIPAVNKIIFESRKRTYVNTAKAYITDAANYVKEMEGEYYDPEATYYIDTYCLNLDDNASSPFSKFVESYVVVGFDDLDAKYEYSWMSYDQTGYGIDLVERDKMNKSDVEGGMNKVYIRPLTGKNGDVYLVDHGSGCQQMKYDYISKIPVMKTYSENDYFWNYSDKIVNITFQDKISVPKDAYKFWDMSANGDGSVMAYLMVNKSNNDEVIAECREECEEYCEENCEEVCDLECAESNFYKFDLFIQGDGVLYANPDSSNLFRDFYYVNSVNNLNLLDTSQVTNMSDMFNYMGHFAGLSNLDLSSFDTSNVTNMSNMFRYTGGGSSFSLKLGKNFKTSNVTDMSGMFDSVGRLAENLSISNLSGFDTSKVTDMNYMFSNICYGMNNCDVKELIGDISKWDVSKVTDMNHMFSSAGYNSSNFKMIDLSSWKLSSLTNTYRMFHDACYESESCYIGNLESWNVSNVTNMNGMFFNTCRESDSCHIGDLSKWNVSNVTDMSWMFAFTSSNANSLNLSGLENWNTSNVTNMSYMFWDTGRRASYTLNLRNWNVSNVSSHNTFNSGVTTKILAPSWVR